MNQSMMSSIVPFLILAFYIEPICSGTISLFPKHHICFGNGLFFYFKHFFLFSVSKSFRIWNFSLIRLPPVSSNLFIIIFFCQYKDNDIGYHTLAVNQETHWMFHHNILELTLIFLPSLVLEKINRLFFSTNHYKNICMVRYVLGW